MTGLLQGKPTFPGSSAVLKGMMEEALRVY
jgi:hypothetical protein